MYSTSVQRKGIDKSLLRKFLIKHSTTAIGRSKNLFRNDRENKSMIIPILIISLGISWCINTAFAEGLEQTTSSESSQDSQFSIETVTTEESYSQPLPVAGAISELSESLEGVISEQKLENTQEETEIAEPIIEEPAKIEYSLSDFDLSTVGYITTKLRVREEPNTYSDILGMLFYNEEITYDNFDDGWAVINYNGDVAFISRDYISDERAIYNSKSVSGDRRKSYMDYTAITRTSSPQYKLQQQASTASNGVRAVNGRYCIALGSYYSHNVGQYVDLVLENGTIIECIIGDCKADRDTTDNHSIGVDGGVAEFIVQTSALNSTARSWGDCSYCEESWNSNVKEIRLYDIDLL